ncbi:hypothetical protein [Paractinoplanes rishiriensis]|uniref:Transmembrane protein n=1 Tax=Paractinoplanes rishiriensis TaxID=1050105 RepID=A0A919JRY1_9ACTN|nr:hypothetical protein [Actinoplanes rishiriensis]GIE93658.1 hypothetical protein Ari01nite_11230 [Actinoplanes rishiriensis]
MNPLWRRALLRAALVPLVVLAPLVALAPTADHRFNVYWHGGLFRDDPLRIVPHTLDSLPGYLRAGNFRPLGRMLEKLLDLVAYTLGDVFGLPANVAFRLVSFAAAVLLCVLALVFAQSVLTRGRLFREPPSTVAALLPFAAGGGLIAAGKSSPVVLFGGLYLTSAAVVLAVAAAVCRIDPDRRIRLWWVPAVLAAGAVLAVCNEIVYLALPLATVAALARGRWVLGLPPRRLLAAAPARVLALMWLGFLPAFVAARLVIQGYCARGACYKGSDVAAGPAVLEAFPVRLVSWFPALMWQTAARGRGWLGGVVLILALLVLVVLVVQAIRDLPGLSTVDRPAAAALAVSAAALVALGAGLGSLSIDVQDIVAAGRWGQAWRDSAVTMPAGALLLAGLAHLVRPRPVVLAGLVLLLAGTASVSAAANKRFRDKVAATPAARLDDRLAQSVAEFDPTPAGAARRCALRAEFFAMFAGTPFSLRRFDQSFNRAAQQRAGVPFCPGVTGTEQGR